MEKDPNKKNWRDAAVTALGIIAFALVCFNSGWVINRLDAHEQRLAASEQKQAATDEAVGTLKDTTKRIEEKTDRILCVLSKSSRC